jgi:Uncharacterized protein conserved in bacteria
MRPVAATGIAIFIRVLKATLRLRHYQPENLERTPQYIQTFWHEHLALMLFSRFRHPIMVMSSRSKDGDLSAGVFEYYGVECARGSSSRGGSGALREMIRRTRKGRNIVFTPDGPRGPRRIAKDGVIFAAQATGLPIVPVAFAAKKKSAWPPGIAWSSRGRSAGRSSSMENQWPCHATETSSCGGPASRTRSMRWPIAPRRSSISYGPPASERVSAHKGIS